MIILISPKMEQRRGCKCLWLKHLLQRVSVDGGCSGHVHVALMAVGYGNIEPQFKHAPHIRGDIPAVTSARTRQIKPANLLCLCVCDSANVTDTAPCFVPCPPHHHHHPIPCCWRPFTLTKP